ncbi:MAG: Fic family protein [Spirochaetes bacterium]|nr:Fic family protein [Spirochaetota bacterium]
MKNINNFKSGLHKQQKLYKSFKPTLINSEWTWNDPIINVLLEQANSTLGRLDGYSLLIKDIDLFIGMHKVKEANTSSKIEGTKTGIDEALMDEKEIDPEKRDDWKEVNNYLKAMDYSLNKLNKLPLSCRLLKDAHKILMQGVRGENKSPGQFRKSQNWIGGSNLTDAFFIPPHQNEVADLMGDLEKFWHNDNIHIPHLIKIALSHYQFETIHPFLDGNGRIGRLLITLYLVAFKLLSKPCLFLSDFFEKNRTSYYDALSRVRESNDMTHWIKFFLNAVIKTSEKGQITFIEIISLEKELDQEILKLGRKSTNGYNLLRYLFSKPLINAQDVSDVIGLTPATANSIIRDFEKLNILNEITGNSRNRMFVFSRYLNIFK